MRKMLCLLLVLAMLTPCLPALAEDTDALYVILLSSAAIEPLQETLRPGKGVTLRFTSPVDGAATLLLLGWATWMSTTPAGGDAAPHYLQAALTGTGYFIVAFLTHQLATRLVREQRLAHTNRMAAQVQGQVSSLVIKNLNDGVLVVDRQGAAVPASAPSRRRLAASARTSCAMSDSRRTWRASRNGGRPAGGGASSSVTPISSCSKKASTGLGWPAWASAASMRRRASGGAKSGGQSRHSAPSSSRAGRRGSAWLKGWACTRTTRMPARSQRCANSAHRRVLPRPALPLMHTTCP